METIESQPKDLNRVQDFLSPCAPAATVRIDNCR